ncbi:MAG: Coenzyme F420 hydrogenase/dehydrogenase, beta subunit C-terminal domain [Desulfobacter sp.]|nr:Coenzyme F420 hydrogenase/dehydrogenase, beta subunit C-terminal domain [Desulfobacter sp.]WDP85435.1 MAG: Coenzyme F420 hydrogenase/dehydrogenase, beta subunit C-terminal domain [Desulfobacter sp.]
MNKTFFNLIQDVQKNGKCHHCGGCVTFCSAINYGALDLDETGKPRFGEIEKCIECGLCYSICPETEELDLEIKKNLGWEAPYGKMIGTSVSRARDEELRSRGTDGGIVTAILTHLFDNGRINGAIVSKNTEDGRIPFLATTREELMDSAGSCFHHSHGMTRLAKAYNTFSPSIAALGRFRTGIPDRLAFVGTPCQINTMRKMQAMGIVPADAVSYCFGLFCSGNFLFDAEAFRHIENRYQFRYADVEKINIKEDFIFTLYSGASIQVPVDELDDVKREACQFCSDFSAEYADISFGGLGAESGWTTAMTRTRLGKEVMAEAMKKVLEPWAHKEGVKAITFAENKVKNACDVKKQRADAYIESVSAPKVKIVS